MALIATSSRTLPRNMQPGPERHHKCRWRKRNSPMWPPRKMPAAIRFSSATIKILAKAFIKIIALPYQRRTRTRCRQRCSSLTYLVVQRIRGWLLLCASRHLVHLQQRAQVINFHLWTAPGQRFGTKLSSFRSLDTKSSRERSCSCVIKILSRQLTSSSFRWTTPSRADVCKRMRHAS